MAAQFRLPVTLRSTGAIPGPGVFVVDRFGELGLWYRVARVALIGGGFGIGGHNPWEAAHLGCAILHGPGDANFASDYKMLHDYDAAMTVAGPADILAALADQTLTGKASRARELSGRARDGLAPLAAALTGLMQR